MFCWPCVLVQLWVNDELDHKVRHPRCVYNKLDWSLYTCLTQLYGGRDMYNLLHKEQLHVSALFVGHLQVDKWETLVGSYTRLVWVVYSGVVRGGVGTRSRMCCVGRVVWVRGGCAIFYPRLIYDNYLSCLPMFLIYQPEDGQWKGPKQVVLYVIIHIYTTI